MSNNSILYEFKKVGCGLLYLYLNFYLEICDELQTARYRKKMARFLGDK